MRRELASSLGPGPVMAYDVVADALVPVRSSDFLSALPVISGLR